MSRNEPLNGTSSLNAERNAQPQRKRPEQRRDDLSRPPDGTKARRELLGDARDEPRERGRQDLLQALEHRREPRRIPGHDEQDEQICHHAADQDRRMRLLDGLGLEDRLFHVEIFPMKCKTSLAP